MVQSKFFYDLLDVLLDGDEDGLTARAQLPFLTESEIETIEDGFVVYFDNDSPGNLAPLSDPNLAFDGLLVESKKHQIFAEAALYCYDGKIDCLEVWTISGKIPTPEMQSYTLTQMWEESPGRVLSNE